MREEGGAAGAATAAAAAGAASPQLPPRSFRAARPAPAAAPLLRMRGDRRPTAGGAGQTRAGTNRGLDPLGKGLWGHGVQPGTEQLRVKQTLALSAKCSPSLNSPRDDNSTASLGSTFQCLFNHLCCEEIPAHVQPQLTLAQLGAMFSRPVTCYL